MNPKIRRVTTGAEGRVASACLLTTTGCSCTDESQASQRNFAAVGAAAAGFSPSTPTGSAGRPQVLVLPLWPGPWRERRALKISQTKKHAPSNATARRPTLNIARTTRATLLEFCFLHLRSTRHALLLACSARFAAHAYIQTDTPLFVSTPSPLLPPSQLFAPLLSSLFHIRTATIQQRPSALLP